MNCDDCNASIGRDDSYQIDRAGGHHHMHHQQPTTERQSILDEARQIISVDRNGAYGEPETNHARIAALWSIYLETPINPRQVALCMALVKIAREIHGPKRDNLVDLAGYAALAGEMPGDAA